MSVISTFSLLLNLISVDFLSSDDIDTLLSESFDFNLEIFVFTFLFKYCFTSKEAPLIKSLLLLFKYLLSSVDFLPTLSL